MSDNNLAAIEGFFRSRCNYKRILELDALILRKDLAADQDHVIRSFIEKTLKEATSNERKT